MKSNSCETDINDMTAVIFAGGFGTRLGAITETIPKPMIEVNGRPLLHYIIEHYRSFGVRKFLILGGYRVNQIKQYFSNYDLYTRDFSISFPERNIRFLDDPLSCQITVLDTGLNTMTGYRLWYALKNHKIGNNFFLTYGDGISDVNIQDLYESHIRNNALITVTDSVSRCILMLQ